MIGAVRDSLVTTGFVSAWRAVRLLPEQPAQLLFRQAADQLFRQRGPGVRRLRANLAVAVPDLPDAELDRLTREAVRSYLRYWCEAFRLPSWPLDDLVSRTRTVDEHVVREAYGGPGAIVALPHMANWDWAGAWACATGMPVVAVAERLQPERLYDEFVAFRGSVGMEIVPMGAEGVIDLLADRLAEGRLVCLLSDRDLSSSGVEVELLGRPARVPSGPAVLARRTGAAVVPTTFAYVGRDLEIRFHPPVLPADVPEMMQAVADRFTDAIRAHPEDWHMMQQVFV